MGIAFDGDADRCLAVDEKGELVDGDQLIALFASHLKEQGKLPHNAAVVTVMSNLGFFRFADENGITAVKTKVGDRYVLEEMLRCGYVIGGEQSGHIIFSQHMTTGDGELSALQLLGAPSGKRRNVIRFSRANGTVSPSDTKYKGCPGNKSRSQRSRSFAGGYPQGRGAAG